VCDALYWYLALAYLAFFLAMQRVETKSDAVVNGHVSNKPEEEVAGAIGDWKIGDSGVQPIILKYCRCMTYCST